MTKADVLREYKAAVEALTPRDAGRVSFAGLRSLCRAKKGVRD
jgi:hypothetical protein